MHRIMIHCLLNSLNKKAGLLSWLSPACQNATKIKYKKQSLLTDDLLDLPEDHVVGDRLPLLVLLDDLRFLIDFLKT